MLSHATIKHINIAIKQRRTFALVLMPCNETPLWFEKGLCHSISPDGPISDKQYSFEISPWLGKFNEREIIGNTHNLSLEMNVQCRSTSKNEYIEGVTEVIKSCRGRNGKTVYSRIICGDITENATEYWGEIADRLFRRFPMTFRYIFYTPHTKGWMGATPELLIDFDKDSGQVHTVAFAGTRKNGDEVQWDAKNIHENRVVSDYIVSKLNELGIIAIPSELSTVDYGSIEHLCSHINGTAGMASLSEIIDAINPTPALCGFPKLSAIEDIHKYEAHNRYCYGGFLAVNEDRRYKAFVNLRCVHFDDTKYSIYGGGGIMPESIPYSEFEETEAKTSFLRELLEKVSVKI